MAEDQRNPVAKPKEEEKKGTAPIETQNRNSRASISQELASKASQTDQSDASNSANQSRQNSVSNESQIDKPDSSLGSSTSLNQRRQNSVRSEPQANLAPPVTSKAYAIPGFNERAQGWSEDVFELNIGYLKSVRGIINLVEMFLSLLMFSLLAAACRMMPFEGSMYTGFFCKSSDTFAFVIACSAFMSSILVVTCCVFSKSTDELLFRSVFEITYYVVYCAFFLTSSLSLLTNTYTRNIDRHEYENKYGHTLAAAIIGIINCVLYGVSCVWFLVAHMLYDNKSSDFSA